MSKKLALNKQLIRSLTPAEMTSVAGGDATTIRDMPTDGCTDAGGGGGQGGTGGWICFTINVSLAACPGTVDKTCGGGTNTAEAGCTTGTAETFYCGG